MKEKRRYQRRQGLRAKSPLPHPIPWSYQTERHQGFIYDMSLYGCFIAAAKSPPVGAVVTVSLPLSSVSDILIDVRGKVIGQKRDMPGFGLCFEKLDIKQQIAVANVYLRAPETVKCRREATPQAAEGGPDAPGKSRKQRDSD